MTPTQPIDIERVEDVLLAVRSWGLLRLEVEVIDILRIIAAFKIQRKALEMDAGTKEYLRLFENLCPHCDNQYEYEACECFEHRGYEHSVKLHLIKAREAIAEVDRILKNES